MMNRCTITDNRALSTLYLYKGNQVDGDGVSISITVGSEVVMDDVSISNNKADGECAAISNSGTLSLENVRTYRNTADNIPATCTPKYGKLIYGNNARIYGNKAPKGVYSKGLVGTDLG